MQATRGLQGAKKIELLKGIERVKWFLWHGNVMRADETLYNLLEEIADTREEQRKAGLPSSAVLKKLDRAMDEFATYVDYNAGAIVNYGERYRCGERISTGFVESAVNQVIANLTVSVNMGTPSESGVSTGYGLRGACASSSRSVSCSQSCISFFALRWLAMAFSRMAACSGETVR
ncbi:hypothetical protein WKW80_34740 [Variovorax humicola]|uniref:Uncharacterized protein n=1 Tax=Variovorax humicola TaxID=1769758 RepID=A0ABU8WAZ3_9BURK